MLKADFWVALVIFVHSAKWTVREQTVREQPQKTTTTTKEM